MPVEHYEIALIGKTPCAPDVVLYRFEKPGGYRYVAGQWGIVGLQTPSGQQTHPFTHASAPRDPHLELMTRLSGSEYKTALDALVPGERVRLSGPAGKLSLPEEVRSVAFLVGGVGITPVRSMLRDAAQSGRTFDDALLVFGNRDVACVPFREELEALADRGVRVVHVLEHPPEGWDGESGFVTAEIVARHVDAADGRLFYVTGPPPMVTAMEHVLDELDVAQERRRVERFGA